MLVVTAGEFLRREFADGRISLNDCRKSIDELTMAFASIQGDDTELGQILSVLIDERNAC